MAEPKTHRGIQRNILQQLPVTAKGAVHEDVVVLDLGFKIEVEVVLLAEDEDFTEGKSHPVPQLIRGGGGNFPPGGIPVVVPRKSFAAHDRGHGGKRISREVGP